MSGKQSRGTPARRPGTKTVVTRPNTGGGQYAKDVKPRSNTVASTREPSYRATGDHGPTEDRPVRRMERNVAGSGKNDPVQAARKSVSASVMGGSGGNSRTPTRRQSRGPARKRSGSGSGKGPGSGFGQIDTGGRGSFPSLPTVKSSSIGPLEAEFFACMVLIGLTIFTDTKASSDYASVMLAAMKRGTMIIVLFFLLTILSAGGANAARAAKAFGALIVVGLIMAQAENGLFTILDNFFKADWSSGGTSGTSDSPGSSPSSANAPAGQQQSTPGSNTVSNSETAASNALKAAENRLPGANLSQIISDALNPAPLLGDTGVAIGDESTAAVKQIIATIKGWFS